MKSMWTSSKPIHGLRHFVLVNKIKEKDQIRKEYKIISKGDKKNLGG